MDIIKTGLGIHKTIKNISRLREILSVFAKNGFDQIIIQSNLHKIIPGFVLPKKRIQKAIDELSAADRYQVIGYRMRLSFEELGPSFVKLGQLLSTRRDLFPAEFVDEIGLLQDKVKGIEFSEAKEIIERNLKGKKIEEVFSHIVPKPIGTASIGVVFKGTLLNGQEIVIKVRRPNIKKQLINDFEILRFIAEQLEKASAEIKFLGIKRVIDDFFKNILNELNFVIESLNQKKLYQNLKNLDKEDLFVLPHVYEDYSSEEVLIMDFLDGTPFNQIKDINQFPDLEKKLIKSVKLFVHSLLSDGFFHADLHGGNFFYLKNGKIGIIDFGLMGYLSKKNRENLIAILISLMTSNYENLVFEFLDVAEYDQIPDKDELVRDIQDMLTPFLGLSVQETDFAQMFQKIIATLSTHQLYLPREWIIIFRALMTLDGVGKQIGIDFNIYEIINDELPEITKDVLSIESIGEDAMWLSRDIVSSLRIIPKHLRWSLKEMAKKNYVFDFRLDNLDDNMKRVGKNIIYFSHMLLASSFMVIGALFIKDLYIFSIHDIPAISLIFWSMGIAVIMFNFAFFRK